jgi:hypothetical protein
MPAPIVSKTSPASPAPKKAARKTSAPVPLGTGKAPRAATGAPPPPPDNVATCHGKNLTIRVVHQPGAGKNAMSALVAITNNGGTICSLTGWPTVDLTQDGQGVGVPTTDVSEPGPPVGMTLSPKRSAFAGLRWRSCSLTATNCHSGTGLRIAAPGANPVQAKLLGFPSKQLTMSALDVGPIQPTTTNITSW